MNEWEEGRMTTLVNRAKKTHSDEVDTVLCFAWTDKVDDYGVSYEHGKKIAETFVLKDLQTESQFGTLNAIHHAGIDKRFGSKDVEVSVRIDNGYRLRGEMLAKSALKAFEEHWKRCYGAAGFTITLLPGFSTMHGNFHHIARELDYTAEIGDKYTKKITKGSAQKWSL